MTTQARPNGASSLRTNAIIISGFVCVGKTWVHKNPNKFPQYHVIDLDSSQYSGDKERFPLNYLEGIRESIFNSTDPRPKIILVSTHDSLRVMLVELGIPYALVYPHVSLEEVWIPRIHSREVEAKNVKEEDRHKLSNYFKSPYLQTPGKTNFNAFATQCWLEKGKKLRHYVLNSDQYLADVVDIVVERLNKDMTEGGWVYPTQEDILATTARVKALLNIRARADESVTAVEGVWAKHNQAWMALHEELTRAKALAETHAQGEAGT